MLAHKLVKRLADVRKKKILDYLRPDGKSQVTVRYENGKPIRLESIVLSAQHNPGIKQKKIRDDLIESVIKSIIPASLMEEDLKIYVNPTGSFVIGGPQGDTGVTGRKIIVDTYGGVGSHGGGCFSGKDPSKVDRSASYFARYLAKNIVAAKVASRCEIQIAYAIGEKEPVSIMVNTKGTGKIPEEKLTKIIRKNFDLSPLGIINYLNLLRPIYKKTACYGHFGREEEGFPWEKKDSIEIFEKEI